MSTLCSPQFNTPSNALETTSLQSQWTKLFWLMLSLHFLVWFIGPMLTMPTAPLDSVEKIALGLQWQWGYSKHPPLTHWLSSIAFLGTGSPKWPLLLMAQISVALCFVAVWQFSRRFLAAWAAFAAVFSLEGIYYFTFATPQFNENIILLPLWSWCALFFYDGMRKQSLSAWVMAGLLAGLACIAKYETVVFLLTLFLFLCTNPQARLSWKSKGVYIALALCTLITLPNLIWLLHHDFLPIHYVLNKTEMPTSASKSLPGIVQPLLDLLMQFATVLPALLLLTTFYLQRKPLKSSFHEDYLKYLALGPALITFTIALLTGAHIYTLWGIPFFIWLGSWLMVKWDPPYVKQSANAFLIAMLILATTMVVGRSLQLMYGPSWNGRTTYQHYPAQQLADTAAQFWQATQSGPLPVIAGPTREVQSIVAYSHVPYPIPYLNCDDLISTWTNEDKIKQQGAVFIFPILNSAMQDLPKEIRARFPGLGPVHRFTLPYQTAAKVQSLEVFMAILPKSP